MNKIIVICGPTATGKTSIGVKIAQKFNGEIISADSRQVYKYMDIGTGKDFRSNSKFITVSNIRITHKNDYQIGYRKIKSIPVWLTDIVNPDYKFNLGEFISLGEKVITSLHSRKKLPIIVGGSGLYIEGLVNPKSFMFIPPDIKFREKANKFNLKELQELLKKKYTIEWKNMNKSDRFNFRRIIRTIEISNFIKSKVKLKNQMSREYDILYIGLYASKEVIKQKIIKRVKKRFKQGIVKEIKILLNKGYHFGLQSFSATGYKDFELIFNNNYNTKNKLLFAEIKNNWIDKEYAYAKRQIIWFKKIKDINWFNIEDPKLSLHIEDKIKKWYTKIQIQ
jgi:tRNA dimethylallyltransferase